MSNAKTVSQSDQQAAQMCALACEIAGAISAIEENDLETLQKHVAAQEVICNRLSINDLKTEKCTNEMREAGQALAQVNRVYTAVIKSAQRTTGLIDSLYRAHGVGYDPASRSGSKNTWSCEV